MTAPAPKKIETIPSEVATDLDCIRWYVECLDAVAFKRRAVAGLAEAEGSYNAAMKRLADRSTRPAEPAAPVAEAGDGEVRAIETRDVWKEQDVWENLIHTATQHFGHGAVVEFLRREFENVQAVPMARLSALEAERARADAAEQRAADALARAEKAEEALETAQSHLTAIFGIETHLLHVGYDEGPGGGNFVYAEVIRTDDLAFIAARAPREAQPATDGGDNG